MSNPRKGAVQQAAADLAHDVFISYSSKDRPAAEAICRALEARGVHCWIAPRDIPPGANYAAAIIAALGEARAMVIVFSRNANGSRSVLSEVERGFNRGLPLHPVRIEEVGASGPMEFFLSIPQWFDAFQPPLDSHLDDLADAIGSSLLSAENPVGPMPPKLSATDRPSDIETPLREAEQAKRPDISATAEQTKTKSSRHDEPSASAAGSSALAAASINWKRASAGLGLAAAALLVFAWYESQTRNSSSSVPPPARQISASEDATQRHTDGDATQRHTDIEPHSSLLSHKPKPAAAPTPSIFNNLVQDAVIRAREAERMARAEASTAAGNEEKVQPIVKAANDAVALASSEAPGYGKLVGDTSKDGSSWSWLGEVNNGVVAGYGVRVFSSGERQSGRQTASGLTGLALINYPNGDLSVAEFQSGARVGLEVMRYHTGGALLGRMRDDTGVFIGTVGGWPNSTERERVGRMKSSATGTVLDPYGATYWSDGSVWVGQWKDGKLDGYAAKLDSSGNVVEQGYYMSGQLKTALTP